MNKRANQEATENGKQGGRAAVGTTVALTTGLVVVSGAIAVHAVRKRRRKKRHLIPKRMRNAMSEALKLKVDDVVTEGGVTERFLDRRVDKLSDSQLLALYSLAKVGSFSKKTGIDPLHPTKDQVKQAAEQYLSTASSAPKTREALLALLRAESPENLQESIDTAAGVLAEA